jgi:cohesin domain-containing protein
VLLVAGAAHGQSKLTLASGSAARGGSVSLELSLENSSEGGPSALQWTLSYPSKDIASMSVTPGPSLAAASKSLSCNPESGAVTCLVSGQNKNRISNGAMATVKVTLSQASNGRFSIPIDSAAAASPDATEMTLAGTAGAVKVGGPGSPTVSALQCSPATLASGSSSTCTVMLSDAAPAGGYSVAVASSHSAVSVPSSVQVASSLKTTTFTAVAGTVSANQAVTLTATFNGSSATATLNVTPPVLQPLTVTALQCSPVIVNTSSTCTVTILKPAPSSGTPVTLSVNNPALTLPAATTVAAGATTATFTVNAAPGISDQPVVLTATLNGSSISTSLTVKSSLAAAYAFDEGSGSAIADASGNWITGQIQGAARAGGKHGGALSFNGTTHVDLGNPASLQTTGGMCWTAWVYSTGHPTDGCQIIAKSTG